MTVIHRVCCVLSWLYQEVVVYRSKENFYGKPKDCLDSIRTLTLVRSHTVSALHPRNFSCWTSTAKSKEHGLKSPPRVITTPLTSPRFVSFPNEMRYKSDANEWPTGTLHRNQETLRTTPARATCIPNSDKAGTLEQADFASAFSIHIHKHNIRVCMCLYVHTQWLEQWRTPATTANPFFRAHKTLSQEQVF